MATIDLAEYKYSLSLDSSQYDSGMSNAGIQADTMKTKLSGVGSFMKTALVGGLAAVGVAVGAAVVKSVQSADELKQAMNDFSASTGIAGEDAEAFNQSLKNIYSQNYGEDFKDIAEAMATVQQNTDNLDPTQIENITKNALALRDTFDYDVGESVRAANTLMEQFGITGEEAYNLIAQGAQNGLDYSGEMMDSISEYSVQFEKIGFSADDMFNIFKNGADSGAFNLDKVGDAVKEFSIRAIDGSKTTQDAYTQLGLNADETAQKFAAGGDTAKDAMSQVMTELANMKDPVAQNTVGVELFGTQWEDLGTEAVLALANTNGEISKTKDTMGQINEIKYDSFGEAMSGIGRQLETGIMLPLGEKILPTLNEFSGWLNSVLPSAISVAQDAFSTVTTFVEPVIESIKSVVTSFADADGGASSSFGKIKETVSSVVGTIQDTINSFVELFNVVWQKWGSDIVSFCKTYFDDVVNNFKNAFALIQSIVETITALLNGDWKAFFNGIKSIADNGLKLILGLFKTGFDLIKAVVKGAFEVIKATVSTVFTAIKTKVSEIMSGIKTNITNSFNSIVTTVKGLPSKIQEQLKKVLTNVATWGTNLATKGKTAIKTMITAITTAAKGIADDMKTIGTNIVSGVWNGIKAMKDKFTKNVKDFFSGIVDSVKDTLGIHSPSRVFAEIGGFMTEGLQEGFLGNIEGVNDAIKNSINTDFDINSNLIGGITDSKALSDYQRSISNISNDTYSNPVSIKMGDINISGAVDNDVLTEIQNITNQQVIDFSNLMKSIDQRIDSIPNKLLMQHAKFT